MCIVEMVIDMVSTHWCSVLCSIFTITNPIYKIITVIGYSIDMGIKVEIIYYLYTIEEPITKLLFKI